jgi:hypothetical protein
MVTRLLARACLLGLAVCSAPAAAQRARDSVAIAAVQRVSMASLDSTLPAIPLAQWLSQTGRVPAAAILWEVNDCGEGGDGRTAPTCVEASFAPAPGRTVFVAVMVAARNGAPTRPVLRDVFAQSGTTFTGLKTFAGLVEYLRPPVAPAPPAAPDSGPFRPLELPAPTAVRAASGAPGLGYWQQQPDYRIAVTLDTAANAIVGIATIRYRNRSPDTLPYLWLQLDQNAYRPERRTMLADSARGAKPAGFPGGYRIEAVTQRVMRATRILDPTTDGTMMRVPLAAALLPGDSADLDVRYRFAIPENGSDRIGRERLASGWLYAIGQWFPRVAVYDDVSGWNTDQYRGQGEFYLEYGDIEYAVTVPRTFIVIGSGELLNPVDVLTTDQQNRLALARASDTAVAIVAPSEAGNAATTRPPWAPGTPATLTWRFRARNVRDVAWAASPAFEWQASGWRGVLLQTAYPPEATPDWRSAMRVVRQTVRDYSTHWVRYPYPVLTSVAAPLNSGMEYPMIDFDPLQYAGIALERVVLHETGHQWMPIVVGSNERRHAWMDEGFDTFMNWVGIGRKPTGNGDGAARLQPSGRRPGPIAQHADSVAPAVYDAVAYDGPDEGLELLRYEILDDSLAFDRGFRAYINRWAFKHPTPADFFRTMNDQLGADYSWFWRWWFYDTSVLDLGVDSARTTTGAAGRTAQVFLSSAGHVPMVVPLTFTFADGTTQQVKLPADVWRAGARIAVTRNVPKDIAQIEIDAKHNLPDVRRENNIWRHRP